jgi:pyridoxamine 5'-phosphate oxidase
MYVWESTSGGQQEEFSGITLSPRRCSHLEQARSHRGRLRQSRAMSTTSSRIADLRKSYERAELSEDASHADPLRQFDQWLTEAIAAEVPEPNAMTLATVASDLRPSTRIVLVKGYDDRGIVWYTNYDSRKGRELAGNPFAALQFHWVELERVVRIEGRVEKTSAEESDAYFASRPLDSRIGAWASPQSEVISGRSVLVANAAKYGAQFMLQPPRPPHWGGYRLVPHEWQFWQGRKSRLHDRLRYTPQAGGGWLRERLAP